MADDSTSLELQRDCEAVQIPHGNRVLLPRGTKADLAQTLGGSFTIRSQDGLFTVSGKDADALGLQPPAQEEKAPDGETASPVDEALVWDVLKGCFDPEIPVNIVDLGLIYDMLIEPLPSGRSRIKIKMTLTAPGCGMGTYIAADAREKLLQTRGVEEAEVDIVWDPPWHPSMITAEGKRALGLE